MESISDIIISENEQNGIFSKKKKTKTLESKFWHNLTYINKKVKVISEPTKSYYFNENNKQQNLLFIKMKIRCILFEAKIVFISKLV